MTLTKNKMVREIGRRTRLKNGEVQKILEALIEVWSEELVNGGRIELENFLVLQTQTIDPDTTLYGTNRVTLRVSKQLRKRLTHKI